MGLAARCALHFEGIVERRIFGIFWHQVRDPKSISAVFSSHPAEDMYPISSAVSAIANMIVVPSVRRKFVMRSRWSEMLMSSEHFNVSR